MYLYDSIALLEDYSRKRHLDNANRMVGMLQQGPDEHWLQIGALSYQFYCMRSDKSKIKDNFKDF